MPFQSLEFELDGDGIASITVNRPEKLNALNSQTIGELEQAFREVESNPLARGVLLTGAGLKAFVAGADIEELAAATPLDAARISSYGQSVFRRLETMGKPSVAAINGFALGGGLELALSCTLRVAVEGARLGVPEVKLGVIPGYGATQRLPRLIGRGRAMELLLTGEPVDATEARRIGLVNHVVLALDLVPFCKALLRKIFVNGPAAIALLMRTVDAGLDTGLEEALQLEAAAFGLTAATDDYHEGLSAFLEKRKPIFTGK